MGILKQPTWWDDASEGSPPSQWEAASYPVTVESAPPARGEFTGTIQFPLGTPIELSATSTPGTPGDADFDSVSLLLHMDDSGFTDSSSHVNTMTNDNGAVYDTSIKKFGSGSLKPTYRAAAIHTSDATWFDYSTGDFTIECFLYFPSSSSGYDGYALHKLDGSNYTPYSLHIDGSGVLTALGQDSGGGTVYSLSAGTYPTDSWHYVVLKRSGSTFTLEVDGSIIDTATSATALVSNAAAVYVGGQPGPSKSFLGNIDEFRMTKGVARDTSVVPVAEFYNQLPTPDVPGEIPGGFTADTVYYVVPGGDVNPLTFALSATLGGLPIVATSTGTNVVATDERFTFLSADTQIAYGGDITNIATQTLTGTARLAYQTITHASAGTLDFEYDLGAGPVDVALTNTDGATGLISVCLDGATQFVWGLKTGSTGAIVAFQEGQGDTTYGNVNFNCSCPDETDFQTLAELRTRMMVRLGFSSTKTNPPPGMADLLTEFLQSSQAGLYKRYPARFTRRFFRWQMVAGQRFFGVQSNNDDTYRNLRLDFTKGIEWSGIQDSKNTWTPIFEGIMPELYTMSQQLGRPVRYEVRECIEVFPAPDGPYSLWLKANITLQPFVADGDTTTIDSEVVFLHALAVAKAHYGQADAQTTQAMANSYLGDLCAGTHLNKRYIPGAHPVMPIVKPALITFQDGS